MMSSAPVLPPGAARQRGICRLDLESYHLDSPSVRSYRGRMKVAARRQGSSAPPQARAPSRRARESLSHGESSSARPPRASAREPRSAPCLAWGPTWRRPPFGPRSSASRTRSRRPASAPTAPSAARTLVHTVGGKIVNIEGDPRSPHNEGTLCPKGAATYQLHVNPNRADQGPAPRARRDRLGSRDLERAMDRVAELVKKTRDETFVERLPNGKLVNKTHRDLLARRRHAGQRVEPRPAEADARPRGRRHREPGPDMTQLQRPRSGDPAGSRRGDHVSAQHGRLGLHRDRGLEHGGVPPGRVPLGDEGQGRARRQAHPRRSALHAHQRDVPTSTRRSARAATSPSSAA